MYRHNEKQMIMPEDFFLPFGGKLNPENRWCKMAMLIPWDVVEEKYRLNFKQSNIGGEDAYSVRVGLGSLLIQNIEGLSDRKLVRAISENPYMQYFIGKHAFEEKEPFDPSLLVHFRKRLGKDIINEINELIAKQSKDKHDDDNHSEGGSSGQEPEDSKLEPEANKGKLMLDATCTPADIHYPTDIWLLNEAREAMEEIIDVLHEPDKGNEKKPRTYRDRARKDYLNIEKKKNTTAKDIRRSTGKQLRYLGRDIGIIKKMAEKSGLGLLDRRQYRDLLVANEIYRQQKEMYTERKHKVEDRIVSLHMPFVRPIVRGKRNAEVEFGAKLSVSIVEGYTYMENLSFDAYNEGTTLAESVENYYKRFGVYPEVVIADKIYRNRENLKYCKSLGIRLSGPPLGRPTMDKELYREQCRQERKDAGTRNAVEGKFGEGKRFYSMDRIPSHLLETSETVIALQILVMNLEHKLRILFVYFFRLLIREARFA